MWLRTGHNNQWIFNSGESVLLNAGTNIHIFFSIKKDSHFCFLTIIVMLESEQFHYMAENNMRQICFRFKKVFLLIEIFYL